MPDHESARAPRPRRFRGNEAFRNHQHNATSATTESDEMDHTFWNPVTIPLALSIIGVLEFCLLKYANRK